MRPLEPILGVNLATRLSSTDEDQQRVVAIASCSWALAWNDLHESLLEEAVADLLVERFSTGMRLAVEALEEHFDALAGEGEAPHDSRYLDWCHKARAAGAVRGALSSDAVQAANEAVYEAAHATDDRQGLIEVLETVLDFRIGRNGWRAKVIAELFWPQFVEVDGYVLLAAHYEPENLSDWKAAWPDSRAAIENVINHVHMEDLVGDEVPRSVRDTTASRIALRWTAALQRSFPEHPMTAQAGDIVTAYSSDSADP